MTRHIYALSCLLLLPLLLVVGNAIAQKGQDTLKVDTVRNKFLPTGIRIGADIISLVKTRTQNNFEGWEVQGGNEASLRRVIEQDTARWRDLSKVVDLTAK